MTEAVRLDFTGPFSWCGAGGTRCVVGAPKADRPGIYLWTVEHPQGDLVLYVGETGRNFRVRILEHLRDQLAGVYAIYDPAALRLGTRRAIWKGVIGRDREPGGLSEYAHRLLELAPSVAALVQLYRFHLAPTTCESRIRRRVEAALASDVRSRAGIVGAFIEDGVRYEPRLPDEAALVISCSSKSPVQGLPGTEIEA